MFGNVVLSKSGRDKGKLFFVTEILENNYVYIIDGNIHKVENQKLKKSKHLELVEAQDEEISNKLKNKQKLSNHDIRRALRAIRKEEENV